MTSIPIRQGLRQGARCRNRTTQRSSINRIRSNQTQQSSSFNFATVNSTNYRINNAYTRCQTIRTALAVEASGLRYIHYVLGSCEDSIPRGWDDDLIQEDEDGT